jgi:hypothetical protein
MEKRCVICGGRLEPGAIRARTVQRLVVSAFAFVRPGVPTSANPARAFLQGLREEPEEELLPVEVFRCTGCGRLELFAPAREPESPAAHEGGEARGQGREGAATVRISGNWRSPQKMEWGGAPAIDREGRIERSINIPEAAYRKIEEGIAAGAVEGVVHLDGGVRFEWFLDR